MALEFTGASQRWTLAPIVRTGSPPSSLPRTSAASDERRIGGNCAFDLTRLSLSALRTETTRHHHALVRWCMKGLISGVSLHIVAPGRSSLFPASGQQAAILVYSAYAFWKIHFVMHELLGIFVFKWACTLITNALLLDNSSCKRHPWSSKPF